MDNNKATKIITVSFIVRNSVITIICGIGVYFLLSTMTAVNIVFSVFAALSLGLIGISHFIKPLPLIIKFDNPDKTKEKLNKISIVLESIAFISAVSFLITLII